MNLFSWNGINLYNYEKNNPFYYTDPDGRFVWMLALTILTWGGGAGLVFTAAECITLAYVGGAIGAGIAAYGAHELCKQYDISFSYNQDQSW